MLSVTFKSQQVAEWVLHSVVYRFQKRTESTCIGSGIGSVSGKKLQVSASFSCATLRPYCDSKGKRKVHESTQ